MTRGWTGSEQADTQASFGVLLKRFRLARGFSQEALAERAGLSVDAVAALESGRRQAPYRETVTLLAHALDLAPSDHAALEATVARRRGTERAARAGAPPALSHNLPAQTTSLVGRERDVAAAAALLRADPDTGAPVRLLTLTGPGGVGKTRLALAVAEALLPGYPDGAWLVELASLANPAQVAPTVATALGLRETPGQPPLASLAEHLAAMHLLLVLDNCEHLVQVCAELAAALLRVAPGLHILATSREALAVTGETLYRVPSLAFPDPSHLPAVEALGAYAAVDLLLQRSRAHGTAVALDAATGPAVAEICARLDGIPLALELAAARLGGLGVSDLAARLDWRFRLLTGGSRTALPRQRTLQATVEWSYGLLTPPEQRLFDRAAVFAGGFGLEAAEAVCAGAPLAAEEVLDLLVRLVSKSLVVAETREVGAVRYRLLETLRQYGLDRLAARGELEEACRRHAAYFLGHAVEAGGHLLGPETVAWLDRLDRDHDNLRAALGWAIGQGDAELGMRLAASLSYFWYYRGHFSESRALRAAVLALPAGPDLASQRAELLQGLGMAVLRQGDHRTARSYLEEGLTLARRLGDRRLLAPTLATLGFAARVQDDYAAARPALEEAVTLARDAGDTFHLAMALHHLGLLALEADGEADLAWTLNEQSLDLFRQIGSRRMVAVVLGNMGRVARVRGDPAEARALLVEAVAALRDIGDLGVVPQMLYTLAAVESDVGQVGRAVRLQAAATALEETVGTRVWPAHLRERATWLAAARRALGDEGFARVWAEGQAMTREQVIADALAANGTAFSG